MLDLLIIIAALTIGIAFFRTKGEGRGLTIEFPSGGNQKGIRTRANAYIVLVIMMGALAFVALRGQYRNSPGTFLMIMLGAIVVAFISYMKSKK